MLIIDGMQYNNPSRDRFLEWRAGKVACVHVTVAIWESARETLSALGAWNRLFEDNADLIGRAESAEDIEQIAASGRTAVVLGFQDTSPFEDDIELVEIFHKLGVRIAQLTYNVQNRVAAGCWEDDNLGVSGFFGRNVIREMNRLGMLIDVSHSTERSCLDAIEYSSRPIAITHGNPAEFVGSEIELKRRNRLTDTLKKLARVGGVVGLCAYPKVMKGGSEATIDSFTEMAAWTVDRLGIDAVAIGTDFYAGWPESRLMWWRAGRWSRESAVPIRGFSKWPDWFQDSSDFPNLPEAFERRGFPQTAARLMTPAACDMRRSASWPVRAAGLPPPPRQ